MQNQDYSSTGLGSRSKDDLSELSESAAHEARRFGNQVSEGIDQAADVVERQTNRALAYLRDFDARKMMDDLTGYARSHPAQALVGAVILGFVTGRLIRRG